MMGRPAEVHLDVLLMRWAVEIKDNHGIKQPARANLILGESLWETYQ